MFMLTSLAPSDTDLYHRSTIPCSNMVIHQTMGVLPSTQPVAALERYYSVIVETLPPLEPRGRRRVHGV